MYAFCNLAAVPMRSEPSHRSEMVNQLLFGDSVELTDSHLNWFHVRSLFDNYEGWVDKRQLQPCESLPETDYIIPTPLASIEYQSHTMLIPGGSNCRKEWLLDRNEAECESRNDRIKTALRFMGAPYLWGGRTVMGIDCSGLVQVTFKICGTSLPRDASQQVLCGQPVDFDERQPGDLAFFGDDDNHIVHVGIVADNDTIIHASGQVRRDRLDSTGIFNSECQCYSHQLCQVRRIRNCFDIIQ